MTVDRTQRGDRLAALIGVGISHAMLGHALFAGLSVQRAARPEEVLKLFTVTPPQPPAVEEIKPARHTAPHREGGAAPRNLRSRATEVVAPPTPILLAPPPIIAAPVPTKGDERSSGASPLPGPGIGGGGQGTGAGGGRFGDGPGGGGIGPRQIGGRIRNSDYPQAAVEAGASGMVSVRYTVMTDGHVSRCLVMRSSGNRDLDETTCRLIEQRFRFRPARDVFGEPVQADIVEDHEWIMERELENSDR